MCDIEKKVEKNSEVRHSVKSKLKNITREKVKLGKFTWDVMYYNGENKVTDIINSDNEEKEQLGFNPNKFVNDLVVEETVAGDVEKLSNDFSRQIELNETTLANKQKNCLAYQIEQAKLTNQNILNAFSIDTCTNLQYAEPNKDGFYEEVKNIVFHSNISSVVMNEDEKIDENTVENFVKVQKADDRNGFFFIIDQAFDFNKFVCLENCIELTTINQKTNFIDDKIEKFFKDVELASKNPQYNQINSICEEFLKIFDNVDKSLIVMEPVFFSELSKFPYIKSEIFVKLLTFGSARTTKKVDIKDTKREQSSSFQEKESGKREKYFFNDFLR
jgi:hypothetical protein